MPGWTPRWDDVVFDHVAADRVIAVARSLARSLDLDAQVRSQRNRGVLDAWEGQMRDRAAPRLRAVPTELRELADRLVRLAADVEAAAADAHADQRHREAERVRWRRERDAEDGTPP